MSLFMDRVQMKEAENLRKKNAINSRFKSINGKRK